MITGTSEYLDGIVKTHQCPEHGKKLGVAWHAEENSYVIRCAENHYPEEVTKLPSRTQQFKQGQLDAVKEGFSLMVTEDLGTGKELSPPQIIALTSYAERYHLDVRRSHVVLMYGMPYITIDGYCYHANRSKKPYKLKSRPLSNEERQVYQLGVEVIHAWIAEMELLDGGYFTGLGIVTQEEMTAKSKMDATKLASPVVAAHPWQLAQKRAEWQAMRRGFPIGETEE